jgi:hypothetical protein
MPSSPRLLCCSAAPLPRRREITITAKVTVSVRITNNSTSIIDTHLPMVARGLPRQSQLVNGSGKTQAGNPYLRVYLKDGVIMPGKSVVVSLVFKRERKDPQVNYSLGLLSGQGQP